MNRSLHRPTSAVIGIGIAVSLVGLFSEVPHGATTWLGFGAIYLVLGILIGGHWLYGSTQTVTFWKAVAAAGVAVLIPVVLRTWTVQTGRPDLPLADTAFVLLQFQVLVPFVAAFMAPFGVASGRKQQTTILVVVAAPIVGATAASLFGGMRFGPGFAVLYHALVLVVGILAGLPLYLYGRYFRADGTRKTPVGMSFRSETDG